MGFATEYGKQCSNCGKTYYENGFITGCGNCGWKWWMNKPTLAKVEAKKK